jgi:glycerol-3-phosphate dehydrogenase
MTGAGAADPGVLILGGGIAGLWLLGRLRAAGYPALLVETRALGGVQTLASQGIIHGGTKYALTGHLTGASQAIAAMPGRWRACLEGNGELDLRRVRLLAEYQYLWSSGGLASEVAGLFASRVMRSRVAAAEGEARPVPFRHPAFAGHLYRLDEPVLDLASLTAELANQLGDACLFASGLRLVPGHPPAVALAAPGGGQLLLKPRCLVLTAGAGNAGLLAALGRDRPAMQRSEERRVGKECRRLCRSRWSPYH